MAKPLLWSTRVCQWRPKREVISHQRELGFGGGGHLSQWRAQKDQEVSLVRVVPPETAASLQTHEARLDFSPQSKSFMFHLLTREIRLIGHRPKGHAAHLRACKRKSREKGMFLQWSRRQTNRFVLICSTLLAVHGGNYCNAGMSVHLLSGAEFPSVTGRNNKLSHFECLHVYVCACLTVIIIYFL